MPPMPWPSSGGSATTIARISCSKSLERSTSSIARCASGVCAVNGWCATSGVSAASGERVPCEAVVLAGWRERVPGCATSLRQKRLHDTRHDTRHNAGVAMRAQGMATNGV
eukprot:scaffold124446_cov61-Phaeocystis_antarctica.AAC.5